MQQPERRCRVARWVCAAVLFTLIGSVLFWPSHVDSGIDRWLGRTLSGWHREGVPLWVDYARVEQAMNVVLFVPFGVAAVMLVRPRWWWSAVFIGFGVSTAVELVQFTFLPGRTGSVRDVVTNTIGAALGACGLQLARRWRRRMRQAARRIE